MRQQAEWVSEVRRVDVVSLAAWLGVVAFGAAWWFGVYLVLREVLR